VRVLGWLWYAIWAYWLALQLGTASRAGGGGPT
jgi:hypothetical protein